MSRDEKPLRVEVIDCCTSCTSCGWKKLRLGELVLGQGAVAGGRYGSAEAAERAAAELNALIDQRAQAAAPVVIAETNGGTTAAYRETANTLFKAIVDADLHFDDEVKVFAAIEAVLLNTQNQPVKGSDKYVCVISRERFLEIAAQAWERADEADFSS